MTTVIHHSADYDGIFCREIARKFLPDATLIGWDFKDPKVRFPKDGTVYILDLSPECLEFPKLDIASGRLVWIDHHKTSIEKYGSTGRNDRIAGYRIDGVAACRLAFQWFQKECHDYPLNAGREGQNQLPTRQDFIDRKVFEPWSVTLAGEYDIWDKRDPNAELFQHGLRGREMDDDDWKQILSITLGNDLVSEILAGGEAIQYYCRTQDASIIKHQGFDVDWEGYHFLALNSARCNSLSFLAGLKPEHDGCLGFKWTGKGWMVSMYGCPGKPECDFSTIATKYGGGGHKQACGFTCTELPFKL